jgi:hypothetical protein
MVYRLLLCDSFRRRELRFAEEGCPLPVGSAANVAVWTPATAGDLLGRSPDWTPQGTGCGAMSTSLKYPAGSEGYGNANKGLWMDGDSGYLLQARTDQLRPVVRLTEC